MTLITRLLVVDIYAIGVLMLGLPAILVLGWMERRGHCHGQPPALANQVKGFLFQVIGVVVGVPISYLVSNWLPMPHTAWPWLAFPVALLLSDFLQYWEHRIEHWLFWRVHAVHHSTSDLACTSNINHFAHSTLMTVIYAVPMAAICGDPMRSIFVVGSLYGWTALTHSPARINIGPLRWVLVENRQHRIHHSLEERHYEKNFGVILNIWDRLFGTYYRPAADEWPETGIRDYGEIERVRDFLGRPLWPRRTVPVAGE